MPLTCRRIGHGILQKTPPTFVFCSKQFPQIRTLDTAMEEPDGGVETTICAGAPSVSTAQKAPKADAPVGGAVPASCAGAQSAPTEEKLRKGDAPVRGVATASSAASPSASAEQKPPTEQLPVLRLEARETPVHGMYKSFPVVILLPVLRLEACN